MATRSFLLVVLSLSLLLVYAAKDPFGELKSRPKIVLFTYSGQINEKIRRQINKAFPSSYTNPDGCRMRITIFVVGQEADPCTVHLLYYTGHEIALSGINSSSRVENWNVTKWKDFIVGQQEVLANISHVSQSDIVGMRVRDFFPGKNAQYEMLNDNNFVYDSSLFIPGAEKFTTYWPFEVSKEKLGEIEFQGVGPNEDFPGLWEVPVSPLFSDQVPGLKCTYLDECFKSGFDSVAVRDLLISHTELHDLLHVNLRERSLQSGSIVQGIISYLEDIRRRRDTWVVSIRDLVKWMKTPTEKEYLVPKAFWECPARQGVHCKENSNNKTLVRVTFARVLKVEQLVLWQTLLFVVLYIVVYQYDRYTDNKNK